VEPASTGIGWVTTVAVAPAAQAWLWTDMEAPSTEGPFGDALPIDASGLEEHE
jgi:hypothetical protein